MRDMKSCMVQCGLQDIKSFGNFYTWNNKKQGDARVFSKLDRMLANSTWQDLFPSAEATFHNEGEFDHSPVVLLVYPDVIDGKRPFKYFPMWKQSPQFENRVRATWNLEVQGTKMFKVVQN